MNEKKYLKYDVEIDWEKIYYKDVHHTLWDLSSFLYQNNFLIENIIETRATKEQVKKFQSLKNRFDFPMDIVVQALKK